jgi:serine/threonine protein phosphatase 1
MMSWAANGWKRAPGQTGEGELVYAVGDIHGERDLFVALMRKIENHKRNRVTEVSSTRIIVLGDFIDRGPHTGAVIDLLHRASTTIPGFVVLAGNHEVTLLEAIANPSVVRSWIEMGGWETLLSYDEDPLSYLMAPERLRDFALRRIGHDRLAWLRGLPLNERSGSYFFCHAGVKPGVELEHQQRDHLVWIRREFIDSDADHGAVIVHGHTITRSPVVRANRIGLDTGAYRSRRLSACALRDDRIALLATN